MPILHFLAYSNDFKFYFAQFFVMSHMYANFNISLLCIAVFKNFWFFFVMSHMYASILRFGIHKCLILSQDKNLYAIFFFEKWFMYLNFYTKNKIHLYVHSFFWHFFMSIKIKNYLLFYFYLCYFFCLYFFYLLFLNH